MPRNPGDIELSIVIPCLNEKDTIGVCVRKARTFLNRRDVSGEVVVANNMSDDGSDEIARNAGARVVDVKTKGYGAALQGGIKAARGRYVIMADGDESYDFLGLDPFLDKLRDGADMVIGNRFAGGIDRGAMPWHHKYIGNPVLSGIGRLFFQSKVKDFHCGLRGFSKAAYESLDMQTTGMEFASEMVVKAALLNMKIVEVPTTLAPDGRSGKPHLRSFRDGWRHLRFLLMFSPRWLFFYPGVALTVVGAILSGLIFAFPKLTFDIHAMLYSAAAVLVGFQMVIFAIFSKTFAVHEKLLPRNTTIEEILNNITLEKALYAGAIACFFGAAGLVYTFIIWKGGVFWDFGVSITMRIVIASFTLLVLGFQIIFSGFFFNMLKLNTK